MYSTDSDDLFEVETEVGDIAPRWERVGKALYLPQEKLDLIKEKESADPKKCLSQVLQEFLKKNYNTDKYGLPSWRLLVVAVSHKEGGENAGLALTIAKDHLIDGKFVKIV